MTRWVLAALLVLGTVVMALSRDGNHAPVANLHADAPYYYIYLPSLVHGDLDFSDEYRETKNRYHLEDNLCGTGPGVFSQARLGAGSKGSVNGIGVRVVSLSGSKAVLHLSPVR